MDRSPAARWTAGSSPPDTKFTRATSQVHRSRGLQDPCTCRKDAIASGLGWPKGGPDMIDRRSLIGVFAGSLLASVVPGRSVLGKEIGDLGVQLYTTRRELQHDFEGTLAKIAAIGYREVEFVELFGHAAAAVRAMLDRN